MEMGKDVINLGGQCWVAKLLKLMRKSPTHVFFDCLATTPSKSPTHVFDCLATTPSLPCPRRPLSFSVWALEVWLLGAARG